MVETNNISGPSLQGIAMRVTIRTIFGGLWGVVGSLFLPLPFGPVLALIFLAITARLFMMTSRWTKIAQQMLTPADHDMQQGMQANYPYRSRAYAFATQFELIGVPAAIILMVILRRFDAIVPAVAIVVGIHFFLLVQVFKTWRLAAIGAGMCCLAVLSLILPASWTIGNQVIMLRGALVGIGSALILWGEMLPLVLSTSAQVRRVIAERPALKEARS